MKKLVLIAGLAIVGCDGKISDAQEAVTAQMLDPESALFRNAWETEDGYVCGEVNGKNSFGGYVGFQTFVALQNQEGWEVWTDDYFKFKEHCSDGPPK